ncbi:unnamed protein product [Lactuca saligna]|uniref:Uncharacterized protein n=1 Tax=Lactuca saligna TaxID=75948 RepID=A0AA35YNB9_LACSI|nr:unnamed protein product [Lactuca saligna]
MNALGWMHRKFRKNNDEEKRNVSTRKSSSSCFSALLGLHEQQYYPGEKKFSAHFRQPRLYSESSVAFEAHSVKEVDEEETVDMSMQFIHTFLAIGTLGSISVTEDSMTPKVALQIESEAAKNELQSLNKLEKLNEKEVNSVTNESRNEKVVTLDEKEINGMDTKDNKSMVICPVKEFSEMPPTKEGARKQKPKPTNLFKKSEAHAMHFMKKMLKKLDIKSQRSPTSANIYDPTEKKPTRVFRKSRKIHPEAANRYVSKSYNSEMMKRTSYDEDNDKQLKVKDEGTKRPHDGMLKKETVTCYPTGEKAHWIKTDAEYFVLEF